MPTGRKKGARQGIHGIQPRPQAGRGRAAQWVLLKFQKFLCATLTAVRAVAGMEGRRRHSQLFVQASRQAGWQAGSDWHFK